MHDDMDYTGYWVFRVSPFDNVPDPRFYVPSSQHEGALQRLRYGIQGRLAAVTRRRDLFTKEAMELIHDQAQGIGRLINALCDACLMAGAQEHVREIDAARQARARTELMNRLRGSIA